MRVHAFNGSEDFIPLSEQRAERRARIAAMMRRTTKLSEADMPPEQRRQILDTQHVADALATGATIEHAAGPTWQQRVRVAGVIATGLPLAVAAAYVCAHLLGRLADVVGAYLYR